MAKQLTVKELRKLLLEVKNQDAPVAFYDSKRPGGKLLPLVAINESVDKSVVTLGFYDEDVCSKADSTDETKELHPGAVCSDCGATMTEDEYSCGQSECCGADVVPEEEY